METEKSKTDNPNSKENMAKDEDILTMAIDQNKVHESKNDVSTQKENIQQQQQQQHHQQQHQQPSILRKSESKAVDNITDICTKDDNHFHSISGTEVQNGKLSRCETPNDQQKPELSILIMKNDVADRIVSNYSSGRENHHDHHMSRKSSMEKHRVCLPQ